MQLGIVGWPKVGKTLLFNILTGTQQETGKFTASQKVHAAAARVDDERLAALRDLYSPKKYTPATVDYVDLPGLARGESGTGLDLAVLKPVDALVHVVRGFEDPEILHAAGSVDPARDVHELDLELVLADHDLVSRRLDKLAQATKRGLNDDEKREQALLAGVVLPALESEQPLRVLALDPDDERRLRGFQLLSAKPLLVAANVAEDRVAAPPPRGDRGGRRARHRAGRGERADRGGDLAPRRQGPAGAAGRARARRAEHAAAGPRQLRAARADLVLHRGRGRGEGLDDQARHQRARRGGEDPLRHRARLHPRRGGGLAGSDRASILAACQKQARLRLEGKDYVVQDGDVINFRFNV